MTVLQGGRTTYGHFLGVLMLDTIFPRPPGDVGNASTWPFPTLYRIVDGATSRRVVQDPDAELAKRFIEAGRELESAGVSVITTSCGFLALYQRELTAAISVPVLSSSLLQVPLAARIIGSKKKVGILTMSKEDLTERHFEGVGWSSSEIPVAVAGFTEDTTFRRTYLGGLAEADSRQLEADLLELGRSQLESDPDVGIFVLECTNMVPYAAALRARFGLPVMDLYTLVMAARRALVGTSFGRSR